MEWTKAKNIAVSVCERLLPYCDRINIAGSIRRQKPEVKDIEIVCQPKSIHSLDLFGEASIMMRSEGFMNEVLLLGSVIKGKPSGRMMVWQSEVEFFEWLQVPFLNPVKRSM